MAASYTQNQKNTRRVNTAVLGADLFQENDVNTDTGFGHWCRSPLPPEFRRISELGRALSEVIVEKISAKTHRKYIFFCYFFLSVPWELLFSGMIL